MTSELVATMRAETARRAAELLARVTSLDDLERLFLYGAAVSDRTRETYREALASFCNSAVG